MSLIEIQEPNDNKYVEDDTSTVVGIDFGTTNSLIALSVNKKVKFAKKEKNNEQNSELIRTIVKIPNNDGAQGNISAINIYSIKRLLGKSTAEILGNSSLLDLCQGLLNPNDEYPRLKVKDSLKTLPELASEIFKYLKQLAEVQFASSIKKAVVSVPAYFDDNAKAAVIMAARIAGLQVIRLIAEPTAAAYAYKLNNKATGCYLVYDLGGGTFDISLLNMQEGVLQVIATGGDNMLGGDDLDLLIAKYLITNNLVEVQFATAKAKFIKEHLSLENEYNSEKISITRSQFEQIIKPLIKKTIDITKNTLSIADHLQIDGIVLVGGSTRIPLVKKMLSTEFNVAILADIDPDRAVAYGAALQAENLTAHNGSLVIDILPLSLGVELYSGLLEKIILRGSPLPSSITKEFTTQIDNQTGVQFHVLQGEREHASDCRSLARFELKIERNMKAGEPKIEVTFAVDADGLLSVSATEKFTGKSQIIEVKPSYGLSIEEIDKILENAFSNAEIDHKNKLLIEAKTEAKSLLYSLKNVIRDDSNILAIEQIKKIQSDVENLELILENEQDNQLKLLEHATEELKKTATQFNETKLNTEMNKMLIGKNIANI